MRLVCRTQPGAGARHSKDRIALACGSEEPSAPAPQQAVVPKASPLPSHALPKPPPPPPQQQQQQARSPKIGTPKFGFEEEDDGVPEPSQAVDARDGGGKQAARADDSGHLLQYKEYVRQMVAHSNGRGMSATKIQVLACCLIQ